MRHSKVFSCLLAAAVLGCADEPTPKVVSAPRDNSAQAESKRIVVPARSVQLPAAENPTVTKELGKIETVATFDGPMPTGVTVSKSGRIFVNYPKWGDAVSFTVAEIKNGKAEAFPSVDMNREDRLHPEDVLVAVQSVVVDPKDRLWCVDTGSELFGPAVKGGPKLVAVDLNTNQVVKKILVPEDVALKTSYLNDIRFDLARGKAGFALLTDSSTEGPNGIVVVDLDSGKSWRRLNDHPSTKAEKSFVPTVEGAPLMVRQPGKPPKSLDFGSDGIAISADGKQLYYCPLASRKLYSVSVDALCDEKKSDSEVAATVQDLGEKAACDGMETDSANRLYYGDYEHNAVLRRDTNGKVETIVQDPRIIWPDTLSVARDGYLYFTDNQVNRMARFHDGQDRRVKPYSLLRVKIDGKPVTLGE